MSVPRNGGHSPVGQAVPDEVISDSSIVRQTAVPLCLGLQESGTA